MSHHANVGPSRTLPFQAQNVYKAGFLLLAKRTFHLLAEWHDESHRWSRRTCVWSDIPRIGQDTQEAAWTNRLVPTNNRVQLKYCWKEDKNGIKQNKRLFSSRGNKSIRSTTSVKLVIVFCSGAEAAGCEPSLDNLTLVTFNNLIKISQLGGWCINVPFDQ